MSKKTLCKVTLGLTKTNYNLVPWLCYQLGTFSFKKVYIWALLSAQAFNSGCVRGGGGG